MMSGRPESRLPKTRHRFVHLTYGSAAAKVFRGNWGAMPDA